MTPLHPTLKTALCLLLTGGSLVLGGLGFGATVPDEAIKQQVIDHVQAQLKELVPADDQRYIQVEVLHLPAGPFEFPRTDSAEEVRITTESALGRIYSERAVVRVHMEDESGQSHDVGVPVRIRIQKPVWVVKNIIPAKSPLRLSDLKLETREVSHQYSHAVGREQNLGRYVARVNLRPGEILDNRKIIIPPDVLNHSEVRILLTNGQGMTVSVPGIAMSDGRIGDIIRVRQAVFDRKYYTAKVIDQNHVLVEI